MEFTRLFDDFQQFLGAGIFAQMTYKDIMSRLASAKKVETLGDGIWEFVRMTKSTEKILERLGIIEKPEAWAATQDHFLVAYSVES